MCRKDPSKTLMYLRKSAVKFIKTKEAPLVILMGGVVHLLTEKCQEMPRSLLSLDLEMSIMTSCPQVAP